MSITIHGNPCPLNGTMPKVGTHAPAFKLAGKSLNDVSLGDFAGKKKILNIVPSLDTGVCSLSAKKFNQKVEKMTDVALITISRDLPFAMARACTESKTDHVISASCFRSPDFQRTYGVEIAAGPMAGLCARAVFVLDGNDTIVHVELVPEVTHEPNYDAAMAAVANAKGFPKLTLYYFPFSGRAGPIRDAFYLGKIPFENVTDKKLDEFKPQLPLGQWPVLDVDGVRYTESNAILNYVGKLGGLVPSDPMEFLRVQEIIEICEDFGAGLAPSMRLADGSKEKEAARTEFLNGPFVRIATLLNKRLEANAANGKFFVGKSPTIADLKANGLWEIVGSGRLDHIPKDSFEKYTHIAAHAKATHEVVSAVRPKAN